MGHFHDGIVRALELRRPFRVSVGGPGMGVATCMGAGTFTGILDLLSFPLLILSLALDFFPFP